MKSRIKLAIHHNKGSFSDRWISYCDEHCIDYKLVNAYDSDIISQIDDCDAFMWHHSHADYRDMLFAKQLLFSLETAGVKVFPNFYTGWYFDDKVGEKYLLEAMKVPMVPSYVFYTKEEANCWIDRTVFPKVFKLRGGAGSANVKLAITAKDARKLVDRAFGRGFSQFDSWGYLKERFLKWRQGQDSILGVCKGIGRLFLPTVFSKMRAPEKGYVYFQDFIEYNTYDIRVIVIGNRAFSIKRMIRKNDFRASGSGDVRYSKADLNEDTVKIAFAVARELKSQCLGLDFVFDNGRPLIVEIGYGFSANGYNACEGYWSDDMIWHAGPFNPQEWMIEDLIDSIRGEVDNSLSFNK